MKKAWKALNLDGDGVQSLNARYTRLMRRRPIAYLFLVLFPLGGHRWYLHEYRGAAAFLGLTCATVVSALWINHLIAVILGSLCLFFAIYDLFWIDRRVTIENKKIRMREFLQPGRQPPSNYKGRYPDYGLDDYLKEKEKEKAGHQKITPTHTKPSPADKSPHYPSLNEQERMLKALTEQKKNRKPR